MVLSQIALVEPSADLGGWQDLAGRVLRGEEISFSEARSILDAPDVELMDLLAAAYRVRRQHFGNKVQLYLLVNAKSGLCPEDCGYCSQSKASEAAIPRYRMMREEDLLEGARVAVQNGAKTYCIVISGRGPTESELDVVASIVPQIKRRYPLHVCACLGLLTPQQAARLKACGVDRVNHNLNTSREYYPSVCSTHTYEDRLATLRAVRDAGLELCAGGIVGMGEGPDDVVRMAFELRALGVHSIPVNFLNPIPGTPLAGTWHLNPRYCLKVLCLFRMVHPDREIRIAGGRELHLRSLQPLGLLPANSIFVGDYLTTRGQPPSADFQMLEDLGFEVARHPQADAC